MIERKWIFITGALLFSGLAYYWATRSVDVHAGNNVGELVITAGPLDVHIPFIIKGENS